MELRRLSARSGLSYDIRCSSAEVSSSVSQGALGLAVHLLDKQAAGLLDFILGEKEEWALVHWLPQCCLGWVVAKSVV